METEDGRRYADMSEEELVFEQSMQEMMLASLASGPGNSPGREAQINRHLKHINRLLDNLNRSSRNHQTGKYNLPLALCTENLLTWPPLGITRASSSSSSTHYSKFI